MAWVTGIRSHRALTSCAMGAGENSEGDEKMKKKSAEMM